MMLFIENIKLALTAIKSNKMRSFLTMLGIIIGVSSVIAITSIGASAKGAVSDEFNSLGSGYMYLSPNWKYDEDGFYDTDYMNEDDAEAFKERFGEDVLYAAPYKYASGTTRAGNRDAKISVYGVAADYDHYYKRINMVSGRMVNQSDVDKDKPNIVIDKRLAEKIFGTADVIGKSISIDIEGGQKEVLIVGLFEAANGVFAKFETGEPTYNCYIAYSYLEQFSGEYSMYLEIYANPDSDTSELSKSFCRWMSKYKGHEQTDFYTTYTAESEVAVINQILGILSLAIGAIAAISLVVGGIGIMNIMLVSVTERTREIGIRKSLGARTNDILTQFLIEAMILSVIGGMIGTALGLGVAGIGMTIAGIGLVINPLTVAIAVIFSAAVGLAFGYFPAKKAAKMDPIEALRYE